MFNGKEIDSHFGADFQKDFLRLFFGFFFILFSSSVAQSYVCMYVCDDSQFYNYCSSSVEDFVNRESRRISMHFKCFTYFLKDLSVLIITS